MNRTAEDTSVLRPPRSPTSPRPGFANTTSYLKSKASNLKFWPSNPNDQTTPKADPKSGRLHQEVNPFDVAIGANMPTSSPTVYKVASPTLSEAWSGYAAPTSPRLPTPPPPLAPINRLAPGSGTRQNPSSTEGGAGAGASQLSKFVSSSHHLPSSADKKLHPTLNLSSLKHHHHLPAPASPTGRSPATIALSATIGIGSPTLNNSSGTNTALGAAKKFQTAGPTTPTATNTTATSTTAPPSPTLSTLNPGTPTALPVLPPAAMPTPPLMPSILKAPKQAAPASTTNGTTTLTNTTTTGSATPTTNPTTPAPRGQLHIKIISARSLNLPTPTPNPNPTASVHFANDDSSNTTPRGKIEHRPFAVLQFEQSEFVSREPIASESEKEVKGKAGPLSRTSSSFNLASPGTMTPGVGSGTTTPGGTAGLSKAFEKAARERAAMNVSAPQPPVAKSSLGKTGRGFSLGGNKDEKSGNSSSDESDDVAPLPPKTSSTGIGWGLGGASTGGGGWGMGGMSPHDPVWKHEVTFDVTSDQSLIYLSIYDRIYPNQEEEFIGRIEVKPALVHDHTVDRWFTLQNREDETVTGEIRLQIRYEQIKNKRALTPRDFEFLKLIGRGTFGKVFQVRKKDTRRIYAMKVLSKKEIIAKKEVAHTIGERKILQRSLESPFLVGLKFSFQTERDLYLVTDFKSGGELFFHLQRETKFTEERARFYIAELVLALEHLHKYDIMYRDLKPENILLDATGHVALCDFGLSKPDLKADQLTNTFCGTTEYLAPEVLLDDQGYSKTVDFWSLGVLLFEMCCGWSPFYAEDVQQMYKNICFGRIKFPRGVIGEDGKQFVKGLLNRNPKNRLGAQRDTAELKEHPFFKSIDWDALGKKQITPPFKPIVDSDESTNYFDPEFTSADLRETGIDIFDDEDEDDQWTILSAGGESTTTAVNGVSPKGSGSGIGMKAAPVASVSRTGSGAEPSTTSTKKTNKGGISRTPISSSVQDHFRGFTFQGDSTFDEAMMNRAIADEEDEEEEEGEQAGGHDGEEDDWEDEEPGGRYSRKNGRGE